METRMIHVLYLLVLSGMMLLSAMPGGASPPAGEETASATSLIEPGSETQVELALLFYDPSALLGRDKDSFVLEVERLLAAARVRLAWLDPNPIDETEHAERRSPAFRAVLLGEEASRLNLHPGIMGATPERGVMEPVVYVFYPAVVRTLGLEKRPEIVNSKPGAALCARAVARVLAHELVHAAAPELSHGGRGIWKARLTRHSLTKRGLVLDEASAVALRAGILRWTLSRSKGSRG